MVTGSFSLVGIQDGVGYEEVYTLTKTSSSPATPSSTNEDGSVPEGWHSSPQSVSKTYPYQWVCKRSKVDGNWSSWSVPVEYNKYVENGQDGISYEYCYTYTQVDITPDTPESSNEDDFIPAGWYPSPPSLSATRPYIWECQRKKVNGNWSVWSIPVLKSRWANDGAQGGKGARMRILTWKNGTEYLQGKDGEEFYDIVLYQEKLYLCTETHTAKQGVNDPTTSIEGYLGFWEAAQEWVFVATKLLLTEKIKAEQIDATNLVANGIKAENADISGKIIATSGVFTGAVKKSKLVINQSNYSNYFVEKPQGHYLDFDKAGLFVSLEGVLPFSVILLPTALSSDDASVRNLACSYVGTKAMIYNRTSSSIMISGIWSNGNFSSIALKSNYVAILECDYVNGNTSADTQDFERIGWTIRYNKIMVTIPT